MITSATLPAVHNARRTFFGSLNRRDADIDSASRSWLIS